MTGLTEGGSAIVDRLLGVRQARMLPTGDDWVRSLALSECDAGYLAASIRFVSLAADELGMDPASLTVTLIRRCAPGDDDATQMFSHIGNGIVSGFTVDSRGVFISAELTPVQLLETTAHEVRHAWQFRQGWRAFHTRPFLEKDAREFGRAWAKRRLRVELGMQ
jgi:hypothetical protein